MAEDQDKSQQTEEPTAKRLEQAREHGDVVKSAELSTFILLGGGTLAIAMFGKYTAVSLARTLSLFLQQPDTMSVDGASLTAMMRLLLPKLALAVAPFFAVMIAAGLAGHMLQSRPGFSLDKIAPDFSKVSPLAGLKRLFGAEGWMNLLKGLAKMAVVGVAIWTQLWPERHNLEAILNQSTVAVLGDMSRLLYKVLIASLATLGLIAGLDYFWQRMRWLSRNRMSKQEIKEEYKQNEGDPQIKAKIRELQRERLKQMQSTGKVGDADVLITNPTHLAVALKYVRGAMEAPEVIAKGSDAAAADMRWRAARHGVPIVERPPLARRLYRSTRVGQAVPHETFVEVARVYAAIGGFKQRLAQLEVRP